MEDAFTDGQWRWGKDRERGGEQLYKELSPPLPFPPHSFRRKKKCKNKTKKLVRSTAISCAGQVRCLQDRHPPPPPPHLLLPCYRKNDIRYKRSNSHIMIICRKHRNLTTTTKITIGVGWYVCNYIAAATVSATITTTTADNGDLPPVMY